jgi:hypothetical protein
MRNATATITSGFKKLLTLRGLGPLSGRSVVMLLALTYLLVDPIYKNSDVVSASLSFGLLTVFFLTCATVVVHGYYLKRRLTIFGYSPHAPVVSRESARVVLHINPIRILPGCRLDIQLEFEHPGARVPTISVTGVSHTEHRTHADIVCPHRGLWRVHSARCEVSDALGLVTVSWRIPLPLTVTVSPPRTVENRLPILSSTQRAGDLVLDTNNRNGDPYDIKPYHPSDGIKKIVWKAYAKRGELLSRHPEASMTPEGHVVIAVLAETSDDEICSQALAYIRTLDEMSLELLVGCLGRGSQPLARDQRSTETLLIESAWHSSPLTTERLQQELSAILNDCKALSHDLIVSKLLLFCDGRHAATTSDTAALFQTAMWLESRGIEPVFCLTQPNYQKLSADTLALPHLARSLLVRESATHKHGGSAGDYQSFLTECVRKQWEVFV